MPEVYRTPKVRSCCRSIRAAADGLRKFHYLEMTDCEFLHVMAAIEHDRNRMRKAIRKGLAVEDDMKGTDSLWQKIQEIRALRMRYAGGVK
jgi:aminoglycoside phosphotransferase